MSTTTAPSTARGRPPAIDRQRLVQVGPYLLLLALCVAATVLSSAFLTGDNITNVLRQSSPLLVVAAGQTLVILVGGIDVSVGALVSLTTVIGGSVMASSNARVLPTVLFVLGVGAVVGLTHYLLIVRLGTDPFVTTLGTMLVLNGANLVYSGGSPRSGVTPQFRSLTQKAWLGVPIVVYVVVALLAILIVGLTRSGWGRRLYAAGANGAAARLSGIRVERVQGSAYVLCSLLAVVGGLILLARIGTGDTNVGSDYALNSIAAVLIGGTSFRGGRGGVGGSVAGVLILTVLFNVFNLLGVSNYARPVVLGGVVIVGIALYTRSRRA
jgi:ribose transport system permease protein